MRSLWSCRRTFLGFTAILCLTGIAVVKGIDTSWAIAAASAGVAAANAFQKRGYEVQVQKPGPPVEGEQ
jgi:hypothetical protein